MMAAFFFRRLKHLASNALSASRRIDIHAAQLHRAIRRAFQAKHSDQLVVPNGYPKAPGVLAIVGRNVIHLVFERMLDIRLEYLAQTRWAQQFVDHYEQRADLSGIPVRKRADGYFGGHKPLDRAARLGDKDRVLRPVLVIGRESHEPAHARNE